MSKTLNPSPILPVMKPIPGANQGFPRRGANPKGGAKLIIRPNFPENCMKIKKIGLNGGGGGTCTQKFTMEIRN